MQMIKKYKKDHNYGEKNTVPDNIKNVKAKLNTRSTSLNISIRRNTTNIVQRRKDECDKANGIIKLPRINGV
jgi:hypothetical protein